MYAITVKDSRQGDVCGPGRRVWFDPTCRENRDNYEVEAPFGVHGGLSRQRQDRLDRSELRPYVVYILGPMVAAITYRALPRRAAGAVTGRARPPLVALPSTGERS